jgi:hypothetical protein
MDGWPDIGQMTCRLERRVEQGTGIEQGTGGISTTKNTPIPSTGNTLNEGTDTNIPPTTGTSGGAEAGDASLTQEVFDFCRSHPGSLGCYIVLSAAGWPAGWPLQ